MISLPLIVLSQLAVPSNLTPPPLPEPEQQQSFVVDSSPKPQGRMGWVIAGPVLGGISGGLAGRRVAMETTRRGDPGMSQALQLGGMLVGSLVGMVGGYFAGYFARQGSTLAKIASIALYAVSGGMIIGEVMLTARDVHAHCASGGGGGPNIRFNLFGGW